jgi:hypothetical protein
MRETCLNVSNRNMSHSSFRWSSDHGNWHKQWSQHRWTWQPVVYIHELWVMSLTNKAGGGKSKLDSAHKAKLQNVPRDLRSRTEYLYLEFTYSTRWGSLHSKQIQDHVDYMALQLKLMNLMTRSMKQSGVHFWLVGDGGGGWFEAGRNWHTGHQWLYCTSSGRHMNIEKQIK